MEPLEIDYELRMLFERVKVIFPAKMVEIEQVELPSASAIPFMHLQLLIEQNHILEDICHELKRIGGKQ